MTLHPIIFIIRRPIPFHLKLTLYPGCPYIRGLLLFRVVQLKFAPEKLRCFSNFSMTFLKQHFRCRIRLNLPVIWIWPIPWGNAAQECCNDGGQIGEDRHEDVVHRDDLGVREQSVEVESDVRDARDGDGSDDQEDDGAFVRPGVVHLDTLRNPPESIIGENFLSIINQLRKQESLSYKWFIMMLGRRRSENQLYNNQKIA